MMGLEQVMDVTLHHREPSARKHQDYSNNVPDLQESAGKHG